ncbi:MAG TPA: DNA-directed RNA polymerase subunit N [Candidatus Diapherotrites archaeon]|uniref:DNA-directed RNA polymerase subunit Rpo10 n=1 Tax=Candidatus Iainarchaeum sp. TaxID=3101447 RepID=A0A7J4IY10_9ARCH|nr:DNA-directed RNA polymerase subunit N [Candidatus Diapherotrites archaeon]
MIVPVRCFSCGKVVGESYEKYVERVQRGEDPAAVLDEIGIKRYCCRRMIFSHVDFIDEILKYKGVK